MLPLLEAALFGIAQQRADVRLDGLAQLEPLLASAEYTAETLPLPLERPDI
jgi:hypothetical protein